MSEKEKLFRVIRIGLSGCLIFYLALFALSVIATILSDLF